MWSPWRSRLAMAGTGVIYKTQGGTGYFREKGTRGSRAPRSGQTTKDTRTGQLQPSAQGSALCLCHAPPSALDSENQPSKRVGSRRESSLEGAGRSQNGNGGSFDCETPPVGLTLVSEEGGIRRADSQSHVAGRPAD